MDDLQVRAAATDIFSYLVEFSPSMVREFVMQEPQQTDDVRILRPFLYCTRVFQTVFGPKRLLFLFSGCFANKCRDQADDL